MTKIIFTTISLFILTCINSTSAFAKFDARASDHCARYFKIYESKTHMPSNLLRAVSTTESGRWSKETNGLVAWPWTINVHGKGYHFESKKAAIHAVKKFQAKGKTSIDVGCMQINLKYHPKAFKNLNQAFEPKFNIEYAATFLENNYKKTGSWEGAIRHYHNANPKFSDKYIARIYKTWRAEDKAVNLAMLEAPYASSGRYITVKKRPMIASLNDGSSVIQ